MSKKIIYGIIIITIIVGITLIATIGLNLSIEYDENTKIYVYIGKQFENKDIKQIAKEVFGTDKIVVQKVEIYEDMAVITIKQKDVNNINAELKDLVEQLNTKINEKYELQNKTEDIITKNEPKIDLFTILKPYIYPTAISMIIILIYAAIIFRKIGIIKTIGTYLFAILGVQALYVSLIAITRLPVGKYTIPLGMLVYATTVTIITYRKQKKLEEYKLNEK